MLKVFKIEVDETDETGVDFLGLVDYPAHSKNFIAFNKSEDKVSLYFTNEEERIVTGVMISEGTPIYRNDNEIGEHYVLFDKATIKTIVHKFFKKGFIANVNEMHNPDKQVEGVHLIESYLVDSEKGLSPNNLGKDIVREGSWVASYKIDNEEVWNKVKSGEFKGFSVEGLFGRKQVNIKTEQKMSKSFKEILFGKIEEGKKEVFAEVATVDGVVLTYDGALEVGTALTIEADGEQIPAPEGVHVLGGELEGISLLLDANGVVLEVQEAAEEEEAEEEEPNEIEEEMNSDKSQIAEAIAELAGKVNELSSQFSAMKGENKELKKKVEEFGKTPDVEPTKKKFTINEKKGNIFLKNNK
jgi:hypothetical protein